MTFAEWRTCRAKRRWPTEAEARDAIKVANKSRSDKKPVRAYECPFCLGWHLTSKAGP